MRARILVVTGVILIIAGIVLMVAALAVLHPVLTWPGGAECDAESANGHLACPSQPLLALHHVLLALGLAGAGVIAILGVVAVHLKHD